MVTLEPITILKGNNGQLELYNDKVIIKRKGIGAKLTQGFTKGEKTIYLKQIAGIQLKLAGGLTNGYIQFTIPGGVENRAGIMSAVSDENSIVFKKKNNTAAQEVKNKIEELQRVINIPNGFSAADEIKKYKELLDQGVLTEEEFNKKKKQLLGL